MVVKLALECGAIPTTVRARRAITTASTGLPQEARFKVNCMILLSVADMLLKYWEIPACMKAVAAIRILCRIDMLRYS